MEIVSQSTKEKRTQISPKSEKCSFSGSRADFYIGLSGVNPNTDDVRIVGAVRSDLVETAINKLLGQGSEGFNWPVVLDLNKEILYHSFEANENGSSAVIGWQEYRAAYLSA